MKNKIKIFTTTSIADLETAINMWFEEYYRKGIEIEIINISHSSFMFNRSSNIVEYSTIILYADY